MHDELERALTGRPERRGPSPFGWIVAALGVVVLAGTVGAGIVAYKVANEVREGIQGVTRAWGATPDVAVARMAARLASADQLVSLDPGVGVALLAGLDGGEGPMDLLRAMGAPLPVRGAGADLAILDRLADPAATDLPTDPATPGPGDRDGVSVRVDSGEDRVALDLRRTAEGGLLTVDSREGSVRVEFLESDEGGRLRILADDRAVEVALGSDATDAPGWVAGLTRIPSRARPVVSLRSDRGVLGAVAWDADQDAGDLLDTLQRALEAEGYEVRAEHRLQEGADEHGSLWARNEGEDRMVFVVAHRGRDGETGVLVGYGAQHD